MWGGSVNWYQADFSRDIPTGDEVLAEVDRISFSSADRFPPKIRALVSAYDQVLTNGGAIYGSFVLEGSSDILAWFIARNRLSEIPLGKALLKSEAITSALGYVSDQELVDQVEFQYSDSLMLEGEIATQLNWGGAFGRFAGTKADARALARGFCDDLMGERLDDFLIQRAPQQVWSPWHRSFIWTSTWLMVDKRSREVSVLCVTDAD